MESRLCEHCGQLLPAFVSRCRRRTCPEYASVWARDTRRKLRENLSVYRTMRSSRLPSSLLILRSCTRTDMGPPDEETIGITPSAVARADLPSTRQTLPVTPLARVA